MVQKVLVAGDVELCQEIDLLKPVLGQKSRTKVIKELVKMLRTQVVSTPIATFENILSSPIPATIYGLQESGKSYTLAAFLKQCIEQNIPFFLIDMNDEHKLRASRIHSWIPE